MKCFVKELYYKHQCKKIYMERGYIKGTDTFDELISKYKLSHFGGMPIKEFAKRTSWREVRATFMRMYY